jgi:ABC-type amino acid transport substrate-binding protein
MNPKNLFRPVLLLAALSTAFFGAHADTLDKIRADKKIRVSIDLAVPPSGMTDASMKPTGSDYDVAVLLARQGQTAEALRHLEMVLKLEPAHPAARRALEALSSSRLGP